MCVHCGVKVKKIMSLTTPSCFSPFSCHGGVCHIPIKHCGVYIVCVIHEETLEYKDRFAWSLG